MRVRGRFTDFEAVSKLGKARELVVSVLTEAEFLRIIGA